MPTFTSIAPHMGIKVRFTKSKGDTLPMPEATTITAVMGEQGYHYDAILLHYYQGAEIKKLYK